MKRAYAVLLLVFAVCALPARPASFGVKPAVTTFDERTGIAEFTFSSLNAAPASFDIRVGRWTQANGNDVYTPEPNIIVVPAIVSLSAYDERLIRIKPRIPIAAADVEQSFRLALTEVVAGAGPTPPPQARAFTAAIFVAPRSRTGEADFRLQRSNGRMQLVVDNRSNTHVYAGKFTIEAGGKAVATGRALGFVLAGSTRAFDVRLTMPAPGTPAELKYDDENGAPLTAKLTVSP